MRSNTAAFISLCKMTNVNLTLNFAKVKGNTSTIERILEMINWYIPELSCAHPLHGRTWLENQRSDLYT